MNKPLLPGQVIGIFGGGQLGRMLAIAAAKLGLRVHIYAPEPDSPAFETAGQKTCAAYNDMDALRAFAAAVDVVTYEFENIPALSVAVVEESVPVYPPRRALVSAQDRLAERRLLQGLGLPVAPFRFVAAADELPAAYRDLTAGAGTQTAFLKKIRQGYDGKGQTKIKSKNDLDEARAWLGNDAAILESEIPFRFEISVIAVRGRDGDAIFYDPPRNTHREGILRESTVPSGLPPALVAQAQGMASAIMTGLDYVGVIGVEMFVSGEGNEAHLIINEIAPRVHNSGHWTLDACAVSQFENHIRAVAGWPLGAPARHSDARMVNLIGSEAENWPDLLRAHPARSLYLYGKGKATPGRKMGHYCDLAPKNGRPLPQR